MKPLLPEEAHSPTMPTEATPKGGGPSEEASAHTSSVDAGSSKGPTLKKRPSATYKRGLYGSYGIIRKGHGYKYSRDAQHVWLRKRNFPCRKPSDIGIEVDSLREPVILDGMCRPRTGTDEDEGQDDTLANDEFNNTLDELSTRLQKLTLESPTRHRSCSSRNEEASWRWLEVIGASAASGGPNTRPRAKDTAATPRTPPRSRPQGKAEAKAPQGVAVAKAPHGVAEAKAASAARTPVPSPRRPRSRHGSRPRSRNNRAASSDVAPLERNISSNEEGWRWMEVTEASSSSSTARTPKLGSSSKNQRPNKDAEDNWRYEELMGASSAPKSLPTEAPSGLNSGPEVAAAKVVEETIKEEELPQLGDIVTLGAGAPPEFRQHAAVVSKVGEGFCTVIVLDASHRYGIGECWPGFDDMQLESSLLRLGTSVIIDGLQGRKTQHLNGYTGTIISHPREGHPTFIRTKAAPDTPQFTTCIRLDHPPTAADRSVLLEPRFLFPRDKHLEQVTQDLGDMLKTLTDGAPTATRGAAGG